MPVHSTYHPAPRFPELGENYADAVRAADFPRHTLRFRNDRWASAVGLHTLSDDEWRDHFGRFQPLPDNLSAPLALRYHGHQFLVYNPRLGDGRGFLFAQLHDRDGRLLDLGTKGSGQTPYSRGGDGRLTLKGGVREILATEMLEARGVYTSKTFSLIETGEQLYRNDEPSPTRSAVMVRLSHSHVRFGSFQRLAYHNDARGVDALMRKCIEWYYPELSGEPDLAAAFLRQVALRAADMAAGWTAAGFVHGVLNTDNMNINGESFDYGPWRFLPALDVDFVAAYFDHGGLYRFGRQAEAVRWNLEQLGYCLAPLSSLETIDAAIADFEPIYLRRLTERIIDRLGLVSQGDEADDALVRRIFAFLQRSELGYAQFFFDWYGGAASHARATGGPSAGFYREQAFQSIITAMAGWTPKHPERLEHPYFRRPAPVTNLIGTVEALWTAIDLADNWQPLYDHIEAIRTMGALRNG
ncbi:MAG: YdiU family protein [Myxococcota bacterium]